MCLFGGAVPVAFAGYWAYGSNVNENILFSLSHPRGVIALASTMVLVHVLGSYQVRVSQHRIYPKLPASRKLSIRDNPGNCPVRP